MGIFSDKFLSTAICVAPFVVLGSLFGIIVAPTIRHFLFVSPLWSTHVKAQVQEAYIVGYFRSGLSSGSATGHGGPTLRHLKFFFVARYEYAGKTYTTPSTSLYDDAVSLPGEPGGGSDQDYFKNGVARLRQVAPNTAYTFLQSKYSELHRNAVKQAMAELPAGIPNAEMDLPILKWAPGWNYYNMPFTDGIRKGPFLAFLFIFVFGLIPSLAFISTLRSDPLKQFFSDTWPGWLVGILIPVLVMVFAYKSNSKPPSPKDLDETVPSSQIHRS